MNIYIPSIDFNTTNKRSLFILTRPFWSESGWINNSNDRYKWTISEKFIYTNNLSEADVYFIPKPINSYSRNDLESVETLCLKFNLKAFGYIEGDFGEDFGNFKSVFFFRMGGFKSQLSQINKGFPVPLSDHFKRIYKKNEIDLREKQQVPVIGFCGHADLSSVKKLKEKVKFLKENVRRFFKNPFRKDYEPFFPSAFHRAQLLMQLEKSSRIGSNFIYRKYYRAGAVTESERLKTSLEYYDNIKNSDYVLCIRGGGNFSVRLYETLMMGRIPVFINTDCLMPFEDNIEWKQHVVWIDWCDRALIVDRILAFHEKFSNESFLKLQMDNRDLWTDRLSVSGILEILANEK